MGQYECPWRAGRNIPRQSKSLWGVLQRREAATQDGDHGECWVLLPRAGAAGGLTCRRCAVVEALSHQVQELCEEVSRLNSIGKDEEVTAGSSRWRGRATWCEEGGAETVWWMETPKVLKACDFLHQEEGSSDLNLQHHYSALIAKEGKQIPFCRFPFCRDNSKPAELGSLINTKKTGQVMEVPFCTVGRCWSELLSWGSYRLLAAQIKNIAERHTTLSYTSNWSLSLFIYVVTNDTTKGGRANQRGTADSCGQRWKRSESRCCSPQLYSCLGRIWVGPEVFCKLRAGCITVGVVSALAFIIMVTSLRYGLLARDRIPRVRICFPRFICYWYKIEPFKQEKSRRQQILNRNLWLLPTPRTRENKSLSQGLNYLYKMEQLKQEHLKNPGYFESPPSLWILVPPSP